MRKAVAYTVDCSMEIYPKSKRTDWIQTWPGQICLATSSKYWCDNIENAFETGGKWETLIPSDTLIHSPAHVNPPFLLTLSFIRCCSGAEALGPVLDVMLADLEDVVKMVRGKIPKLVRKTVSALCVIDVHNRDVTAKMKQDGIGNKNDFEWMCQMRYYWQPGGPSATTGMHVCKSVDLIHLHQRLHV